MLNASSIVHGYPLAATIIAVVLLAASPVAHSQSDAWRADLHRQLLADFDCELNYLTGARSYQLLGRLTVEARAHCMDKRAFDVTRSGDEKAFKVQSCAISTC